MKRVRLFSVILAFALAVMSMNVFAAEAVENTVPTEPVFVMTENGGVMGVNYDGVERYLGIPYAAAERFQLPQELSWEGYMSCLNYGAASPQTDTTARGAVSMWNLANTTGEMVGNENCLNLNVWTQNSQTEELKPVIFWIHGGGFNSGSSHELTHYEGTNLTKYGDVVFVSVNHRLNVLGYLDLSSFGEKYKYSGNAGIADLVAALEWVHRNISAFGGDPENVTLVGQSGGAAKVLTLMGVPSAKGLFHKALIQSGDVSPRTQEDAQENGKAVVEALGLTAETVDQILDVPYEQLLEAANSVRSRFGPVVDGDFYPDGTIEMSKDIPIITGNTQAELTAANTMGLWYVDINQTPFPSVEAMTGNMISNQTEEMIDASYKDKYGDLAEEIKEEFARVYPDHNVAEGIYVNDRTGGGLANLPVAQRMTELGGTAYNYLDVYVYPFFGGIIATHTTTDIPFFFHNVDKMGMYVAGDEVNAYHLQDVMSTALVNFAYTGDPSQEGLEWKPYTFENGECMIFDKVSSCQNNPDGHLLELIKAASDSGSAEGQAEAAPAPEAPAGEQP